MAQIDLVVVARIDEGLWYNDYDCLSLTFYFQF